MHSSIKPAAHLAINNLQKVFLLSQSTWNPLHRSVAIIAAISGCFKRNQAFNQRPAKETASTCWNAAHCETIWFLVDTFTRPRFCAILTLRPTVHTQSQMSEELCLPAHPVLQRRTLTFLPSSISCQAGLSSRSHGCATSRSSNPGWASWLREVTLQTPAAQTQRGTMWEPAVWVPGSVHETWAAIFSLITKPQNLEQHSAEFIDAKTNRCFSNEHRGGESTHFSLEQLEISLSDVKELKMRNKSSIQLINHHSVQQQDSICF